MLDAFNPDIHDRLEKAVLEVFSKSDFHKASIRDVAKKAGVSFTTIYKHYGSKERLVFAFVDVWLGKLTDRIVDHLQGIEDLKEKLRKVFWLQLDYYERHTGLGRILFMTLPMKTWMADETFQQRKMIDLLVDVLRQGQQEGILNPHVKAGVLLDFIMGFVQRTFFMWILRGQKESLSEQANTLFEMVWRGITNPDIKEKA
ncbi:TetR/AcrR family transcriptional regulator [Desulfococcus multivorans]|jgi:AcrR family transcriptional regulator|uniref:Transcriptional regulator, TetR family n=1 Tax=Desulfococcus multivorans DSM 2059 TaxID=1121405 RepID=S7TZJ9_DESML|nr:TetR/AcrR family transcriptional regulator [Desulfococcus multivorans]AOY60178.1 transcriptional regulator, TetR family [Desulfococcus multivorans]AQV02306.1 TetR family transcriptional regulator [Desulfococcus multivorans]EPR42160.1 transcriptional regulator, TetR family [Desulfococcus multivorans DSM 2059]SKA06343.1 transcriptional regulator, TetR family [Desulfococcus multivorans DSM 2059]